MGTRTTRASFPSGAADGSLRGRQQAFRGERGGDVHSRWNVYVKARFARHATSPENIVE